MYELVIEAGRPLRLRNGDAVYDRPFVVPGLMLGTTRLMMSVEYDDGDRFCFYTGEDDPAVKAFRAVGL